MYEKYKKKEADLIDDDVFDRAVNLVKSGGSTGSLTAQKDAALSAYLNRDDFKYNVNNDALYQQYKDKYIKQGQQAMQDTMGQAAALTGGYGSSYAQNVGQQAYNSHLQKLNDVVPELYQMAYDRYQDKGAELLQRYGLLADEEREAYDRQHQKERDAVSDSQWQQGFDHQKERDAVSDSQWQQNFNENQRQFNQNYDYQVSQDAESSTKEKAYALAAAGDYSGIEALYGMTPEQAKAFAVSQGLVADDSQMTESKAYAMALTGDYTGVAQLHGLTPEEAEAFAVANGWAPQAQESEAETYTYAYTDPETNRAHYLTSDGKDVEFDKGINPYNGDVADDTIIAMQKSLGVPATGTWDQRSRSAAKAKWGVSSADDAARHYQAMSDNVPYYDDNLDVSYFNDFTAGDWEAYFAAIRIDSGVAAAEEELDMLIRGGVIPTGMINYAAIGARGGQKGH